MYAHVRVFYTCTCTYSHERVVINPRRACAARIRYELCTVHDCTGLRGSGEGATGLERGLLVLSLQPFSLVLILQPFYSSLLECSLPLDSDCHYCQSTHLSTICRLPHPTSPHLSSGPSTWSTRQLFARRLQME